MNTRFLLVAALTAPAAVVADSGSSATAVYELRGFFGAGDSLEVSIRIGRTDTSYWLKVGERFGNLTVVSADPVAGTVVIDAGGIRRTLRLEKQEKRAPRT